MGFGFVCVLAGLAAADAGPGLRPLPRYSAPDIVLEASAAPGDGIVGAEFFWKSAHAGEHAPWQRMGGARRLSATQTVFSGTHGETYRFACALNTAERPGVISLADFEDFGDLQRIGFVGSEFGFRADYITDRANPAEGERALAIRYQYGLDGAADFPEGAMVGFPFTSAIPLRDWSPYNALDFALGSDAPEPLTLFLKTGGISVNRPVSDFELPGGDGGGWRYYRIDLNETLGEPAARTEISVFAFAIPVGDLDVENGRYTARFDAFRLWADRHESGEVTVDATPPPPPSNLAFEKGANGIRWTWDAPEEDVSGIAGYAYSWSRDARDTPEPVLRTETPSADILFPTPRSYRRFYFKVMARNGAGLWSEPVTGMAVYNPSGP